MKGTPEMVQFVRIANSDWKLKRKQIWCLPVQLKAILNVPEQNAINFNDIIWTLCPGYVEITEGDKLLSSIPEAFPLLISQSISSSTFKEAHAALRQYLAKSPIQVLLEAYVAIFVASICSDHSGTCARMLGGLSCCFASSAHQKFRDYLKP